MADILINLENSNNHGNKKKHNLDFRIYVVEFKNMNYMKFSCFCNLYAIGRTWILRTIEPEDCGMK